MKPAITITTTGEGTLTTDDQTITINTGNPDSTRSLLTSIAKNRHTGPLTLTIDGHTTTINPDTDTDEQPDTDQHVNEDQPVDEATPTPHDDDHTHSDQDGADDNRGEQETPTADDPDTSTQDQLIDEQTSPDADTPQPSWQPRRADPIISGDPQPTEQNTTDDLDTLFTLANLTAGPHRPAAPAQLTDHIITLANLKGGTGKTPLAVILAQALATTAGHDDIVVVEINPRGTLSTRAPRHTDNTVIDLARAARHPEFASQPRDLDPYISWQPGGWATITCPPTITDNHNSLITPPTADDLDRIITALRSRFHVIILDTGNNDLDAAWQHAITIADHIIIPVQWDPDTLTLTQNMVRDMNHLGATHLKNRCIWVGTHAPIDLPKRSIKKSFTTALIDAGWTVHTLPADRHIASDGTITWTKLARRTRKAATTIAKATL